MLPSYAQGGFTEQDRQELRQNFQTIDKRFDVIENRLTALETKVTELEKSINYRFELQQSQTNNLFILITTLLSAILILFGYVIWDRKNTLKPILSRTEELEKSMQQSKESHQKIEKLQTALKELSKDNPKLADILKNLGIY